jgi:hypothetical protein
VCCRASERCSSSLSALSAAPFAEAATGDEAALAGRYLLVGIGVLVDVLRRLGTAYVAMRAAERRGSEG